MRVERLSLEGDADGAAARVRALAPAGESVRATVEEVIERVAAEGDAAVLDLTRRLDTGGATPWPLRVDALELREALDGTPAPLREALELAAANVRAVALAGLDDDREVELQAGQRIRLREVPARRAAIYVPGGRAPYPSTVVMGAVTAQAAGVADVVVCAPSGPDGQAQPAILAACALCGVDEVYRMGGAQAIAALALGTEGVRAVDVVAGPGNLYVQEAKRALCDRVGIDGFAGPSDLLVLLAGAAGRSAAPVALDLLAQAEHGPGSVVVAVSPDARMLDAVHAEIERATPSPAGEPAPCVLATAASAGEALEFAEAFAPEHLQLVGADAEALAPRVGAAGCVFVGLAAGTAFGDYVAGSNHVLPTGGSARFASVLSPAHFRRRMTEVHLDARTAARLAPAGAAIARAEGFEAHARSMEARMGDNGEP